MIKSHINNNTNNTNVRRCHCKHCGASLEAGQGVKIYARNIYGFACPSCSVRFTGGYTTENGNVINKQTKTNKCTISIELEVPRKAINYNSEREFAWLINEAGYLKTNDCTVWAEFKSPTITY